MKKYTVIIRRETQVEVTIDESIVDKKTLDVIADKFDEDLFELDVNITQAFCEKDYTEEEIGYINYAKYAAMDKIDLTSEFIQLEKGHTKAVVEEDDFEFDISEEK